MNYVFLIITLVVIAGVLGTCFFTQFEMSNKQYDRLKWLIIRWSYIVTFIGLIATTFSLSYGTETVTIVGGIGALIAGMLGISTMNYYTNNVQTKFNEDAFNEMLDSAIEPIGDGNENTNDMSEEQ